jgi:LPXTG-motif cell wall-anchored protein
MSRLSVLVSVLVAAFFVTMAPAPASAETTDKLTNLTFNRSVQIPGVLLNAGTYRFRLADPDSNRKIVQVLSHDGSHVYASFHTMPASRMEATDDAIVTFMETPAGVPPAVMSLFYGGELSGYEFMYPRGEPVMTAKVTPQPPITYTYTPAPAAVIPEAKPLAEPTPAPWANEPVAESTREAAVVEPAVAPAAELPQTASPLPLFAFGGFASLVLGLGAGLLRRRLN